MCHTRRRIEGGVGELRESDDSNFTKPIGQSSNIIHAPHSTGSTNTQELIFSDLAVNNQIQFLITIKYSLRNPFV